MKILEIQMKNFGKFSNRTIGFHEGVNILYGKNEAGKSTIHAFLRAMLFGIEKARGRRAKNDEYSLREPWENPGYFAGVMRFESGGKVFRLERNFNRREKSASLVCETDGEELSVENGDLDVLLEGMNEASYSNTFFVGQRGAATEEALAKELHNYMSNLQNAGDAEIDVKKAILGLEMKRRQIEAEKKKVQAAGAAREREARAKLAYVQQETERLKREEAECEERLRKIEEEHLRAIQWAGKQETGERQGQYQRAEEGAGRQQAEGRAGQYQQEEILAVFALGILSLSGCIFLPWIWAKCVAGVICVCAVWGLIKILRKSRKEEWSSVEERYPSEREKQIWEQGRSFAERDEQFRETNTHASEAETAYSGKRHTSSETVRQQNLRRLSSEIEKQKGRLEHIRSELREKQTLQENLRENLTELSGESEDTARLEQEASALRMAMEVIEEASKDVYSQWEGRLNRRVSEILGDMTCGRYTSIFLDADLHIRINTPKKLLGIWQVSKGTMEQIYFALRMAAGEIFTGGESVPVILDEAFAMYDDERLEQTLRWLEKNKEQVILFTCQEREKRILERIRGE